MSPLLKAGVGEQEATENKKEKRGKNRTPKNKLRLPVAVVVEAGEEAGGAADHPQGAEGETAAAVRAAIVDRGVGVEGGAGGGGVVAAGGMGGAAAEGVGVTQAAEGAAGGEGAGRTPRGSSRGGRRRTRRRWGTTTARTPRGRRRPRACSEGRNGRLAGSPLWY